jgi:hypothetical protein
MMQPSGSSSLRRVMVWSLKAQMRSPSPLPNSTQHNAAAHLQTQQQFYNNSKTTTTAPPLHNNNNTTSQQPQ